MNNLQSSYPQNIQSAIELAKKFHHTQKRIDGTEYITHPLGVMHILEQNGFTEEELLIPAVLHDLPEDTELTNVEIFSRFGERIGFIVDVLTKVKRPEKQMELENYKKEKHLEPFEDYFDYRFLMYVNRLRFGILADPFILFIKMADQIDNLKSLEAVPKDSQKRKIREITELFLPMYKKSLNALTPPYLEKYRLMEKELFELIKQHKLRLGMH